MRLVETLKARSIQSQGKYGLEFKPIPTFHSGERWQEKALSVFPSEGRSRARMQITLPEPGSRSAIRVLFPLGWQANQDTTRHISHCQDGLRHAFVNLRIMDFWLL